MNLITCLFVAAIFGWIAAEILHDIPYLRIYIAVAILGAYLTGSFLTPVFKLGTIKDTTTGPTMLVMLLGSITLVALTGLIRFARSRLI